MLKLITHNDLDGVGCGIIASYILGNGIDISYCSNHQVDKVFSDTLSSGEYEMIILTDVSINKENAEKVKESDMNVLLLDHHPTALWLNEYPFAKVFIEDTDGTKTCGTQLFASFLYQSMEEDKDFHKGRKMFEMVTNKVLWKFVKLVTYWDTWQWKEENILEAKELNMLFDIYGLEEFSKLIKKKFENYELYGDDSSFFGMAERHVLKLRQREIDDLFKKKNKSLKKTKFEGYNVGVIFCDRFYSEIGNRICKENSDIDFVVMLQDHTTSLRGIDKVNLGDIAKKYGGGGHNNAAGFPIGAVNFIDEILGDMNDFL